jgi:hypothetical protein
MIVYVVMINMSMILPLDPSIDTEIKPNMLMINMSMILPLDPSIDRKTKQNMSMILPLNPLIHTRIWAKNMDFGTYGSLIRLNVKQLPTNPWIYNLGMSRQCIVSLDILFVQLKSSFEQRKLASI